MAQPWFKFFAGDFLADPDLALLTFEQRGMLVHLWAYAWRGGSLPADEASLAALLGLTPRAFRGHAPKLLQFFKPDPKDPSRIVSPRMELERAESEAKGSKARESATARWSRRNANAMRTHSEKGPETDANALRSQCEPACESDAKPMLSESESEKDSPLAPQGASPAAPRGRAKGSGSLWPAGWDQGAEDQLQELLKGYPGKRPNGAVMSNGTPKELRDRWLAIMAANPGVTPRLLKACAWCLLEELGEDNAYLPLLTTVYGPKKATWERYRAQAERDIRDQDAREQGEPMPLPLRPLAEVAHA